MAYYIYKITNNVNGSIETLAEECPEGYIKGRLPRRVSKLSM